MNRGTLLTLLAVALLAPAAMAKDLNPPPWDPGLPNQTSQYWEATASSGTLFVVANPFENPYCDPSNPMSAAPWMTATNAHIVQTTGPDGNEDWTWHIGADGQNGGTVSIWIPNNPEPELYKLVFWQMTSDKSPTPAGNPPTTNPPGTVLAPPYTPVKHSGDWYTYNGLLQIVPNPRGEWITFELAYCTHIEEIVIKTICIPEPATLGVLACGALALRRRRR
ncbi:MAG: hypothetical protein MUP47_05960 [Phycisphaerae bacterium]|nr:hypothetical protein [Phycisphaerae bacterium]